MYNKPILTINNMFIFKNSLILEDRCYRNLIDKTKVEFPATTKISSVPDSDL